MRNKLNLVMFQNLEDVKKIIEGPACVYVEGLGEVQINSTKDIFCIAGQAALRFHPELYWDNPKKQGKVIA
jgi:hypothetical protein